MNARNLLSLLAPLSTLFFAGCAAPSEEAADDSTGAMTAFAEYSKFELGDYKGVGNGGAAELNSNLHGRIWATIWWSDTQMDGGLLDVPLTDRSIGTNDESGGPNGVGGTHCGFTVRALEGSKIRATSDCGRGDIVLVRYVRNGPG